MAGITWDQWNGAYFRDKAANYANNRKVSQVVYVWGTQRFCVNLRCFAFIRGQFLWEQ